MVTIHCIGTTVSGANYVHDMTIRYYVHCILHTVILYRYYTVRYYYTL